MTRICKICKHDKDLTEFYVTKMTKDGNPVYRRTCKQCQADKRKHAPAPIDIDNTRVCSICQAEKPITNFRGRGNTALSNGTTVRYRSSTCRTCDKAQKVANGICKMCNRSPEPGKHHCEKHLALMRRSVAKRNAEDKRAAFAHYGGKCTYCGETEEIFLTIDHTDNNGAEHRREQRSGNNNGHNIYAWLRKNNYPDTGFQILCFNCNCAKGIHGEQIVLDTISRRKSSMLTE